MRNDMPEIETAVNVRLTSPLAVLPRLPLQVSLHRLPVPDLRLGLPLAGRLQQRGVPYPRITWAVTSSRRACEM